MNSLIEDKDFQTGTILQRQLKNSTKSKFLQKAYFQQQNGKYIDNEERNQKLVNLFFTHSDNGNEMDSCLIDLKYHIVENKTKLIILGFESDFLKIVDKMSQYGIDVKQIPFAIYSPEFNDDLAKFLGWNSQSVQFLAQKSPNQLSLLAKQWITSPSQKIDFWQINLKVKQDGKIQRLEFDQQTQSYVLKQIQGVKQKKTYFLSSITVGYHSKAFLQLSQSQKPSTQPASILSRWRYNFLGMKKFCCLGENSMRTSTGIVNISFKDEQNRQVELMKQFADEDEGEQLNKKTKKRGSKKKVLSIVLANLPLYNQLLIQTGKMNDSKVQLLVFGAKTDYNKIASIGGEIKLKFQTYNTVYLKVGDQSYVLEKPSELILKNVAKMKALINKETVGC